MIDVKQDWRGAEGQNLLFLDKQNNMQHTDLEQEIWEYIPNFSQYQISYIGRIKSFSKDNKERIILKQKIDKYGYPAVGITNNNGIRIFTTVHRLVAMVFISNHENKPQVNHKNGIKTDNRIINLEWATAAENVQHSYDIGLKYGKSGRFHPTNIPVFIADIKNMKTISFSSMREAIAYMGIKHLWKYVTGIYKKKDFIIERLK